MDVLIDHVFQPIVRLDTGRATHWEMLVRSVCGTVDANTYVKHHESASTVRYLDCWNLERAISLAVSRRIPADEGIAVNVSPETICHPHSGDWMRRVLESSRVAPQILLEITERGEIATTDEIASRIQALRAVGAKVGLDDYGAGDCREGILELCTLDFIKIDGEIVESLSCSSGHASDFVEEVVYRASLIGAEVIAERVSGRHLVERLLSFGVELGQGNFLGSPQPLGK